MEDSKKMERKLEAARNTDREACNEVKTADNKKWDRRSKDDNKEQYKNFFTRELKGRTMRTVKTEAY